MTELPWLTALIVLPLVGALVTAFVGRGTDLPKNVGLGFAVLTLVGAVVMATVTPMATMSTVRPVTARAGRAGSAASVKPVTGSSQFSIQPPISITPPSADRAASTISGIVITDGDSCGWTSLAQRFSPK